jgi:hypothetical protein
LTTSTISLGHWSYDRLAVRDHRAMAAFGLCDTCRHQRLVRTGRGSVFTMCLKSREDPRFPKYPPVPVTACAGYEKDPAPRPQPQ